MNEDVGGKASLDKGEIWTQLEALDEEVKRLSENIDALVKRLNPITKPEIVAKDTEKNVVPEKNISELAAIVREQRKSIVTQNILLLGLLNTIEI